MSALVFQVDDSPFLTPYTFESARLQAEGIDLVEGFCETTEEVITRAAEADVLWLSWKPRIDRAVLEALPRVRLAMRWGIGYEQIDTEAATDLGVAVANAPTYGSEDVAEHALALLFALGRRLVSFDREMREGGWSSPQPGSIRRVQGKTLGLLGVGRIGAALALRAQAVGLQVVGSDLARTAEELRSLGIEPVSLADLAVRADYLSIHVPHTPQTEGLVDAEFLGRMKPEAYVINTSRGRVIDEEALVAALQQGVIAGAGLDVFAVEPLPTDNPLRQLPNVILTPHYAGYSEESWANLREEMCSTTIEFLQTGWAAAIVNPDVRGALRPARL